MPYLICRISHPSIWHPVHSGQFLHHRRCRRRPHHHTERSLLSPDEFIVFAPYFPEYAVFVAGAGGKMVTVADTTFQIDLEAFQSAVTPNTKAVL